MARPAGAQPYQIVGPNKCMGCHDHEPQKLWAEKKEGPKSHLNALSQLDDKRSAGWGKAVGIEDVFDLKGSCVKCHATPLKGSVDFGVSCESCHGPGSGYLEPHQQKGSYRKAVSLGMYDTRVSEGGSYAIWAKMCLDCHVLKDQKLIAAGHPSGAGFDLADKSFGQVVHWKEKYDKSALASGKKGGGPPPKAEPTKAEAPKVEAKVEPTKPAAKGEPTKAAKGPEPTAAPGPRPTTAAAPVPTAQPTRGPVAPAPTARPGELPTPAPAATQVVAEPPTRPVSVATPRPVAAPVAIPEPVGPRGALAEAAAARGKVLVSLGSSLASGKAAPAPKVTLPSTDYRGPDGELLRLQDETLRLLLEALSEKPKEKK